MLVDLSGLAPSAVYHLMTQVVVPRPIAWVVSDNGGDQAPGVRWNLAPFSYFNAVASEPPMVMFSVGTSPRSASEGGPIKDTLANITERPRHTIALPHEGQRDVVEATSAPVAPSRSEFGLAGLDAVPWDWPVPMPAGVRVALGCTVDTVVPLADGPQRLVLARVERLWVDDVAVGADAKGRTTVDARALDPLLRLGAGWYGSLGSIARPGRSVHGGP